MAEYSPSYSNSFKPLTRSIQSLPDLKLSDNSVYLARKEDELNRREAELIRRENKLNKSPITSPLSATKLIADTIWPEAEPRPVERPHGIGEQFGSQNTINSAYKHENQTNMLIRESLLPHVNPPPGFGAENANSSTGFFRA